jgi:hypothetical protein
MRKAKFFFILWIPLNKRVQKTVRHLNGKIKFAIRKKSQLRVAQHSTLNANANAKSKMQSAQCKPANLNHKESQVGL